MKIIHNIDDFLFELFPAAKSASNPTAALKDELEKYYTFQGHRPVVEVEGSWISVSVDVPKIIEEDLQFNKVLGLAQSHKYDAAARDLEGLINQNPTNSEYHRVLGQILSEQGNQEEAINSLIDALRWDSKNVHALTMMGNIFARYREDMETAMKYYNQVLGADPDNYIAINNIGANLLKAKKFKEAAGLFEKAHAINPAYPNTLFGLASAYDGMDMPVAAFQYAIDCIKSVAKPGEQLYQHALSLALQIGTNMVDENERSSFKEYKAYLEGKTGKKIRANVDHEIPTAAKIEFAENYDRPYHQILYKPAYPAVEHLMMHELVHLEFATEARERHANMLFISGHEKRVAFLKTYEADMKKLERAGISDTGIAGFMDSLYNGINSQVFNTPIDLFIEDFLFETYPELRPIQFISLTALNKESAAAVTSKQAKKFAPREVHSASKVLNLVAAIHYKDLYGIDTLRQFDASPSELKQAHTFWEEFNEYRKDREPGEEYELVKHWGEDLKLDRFFELVDEEDFRARPKTVDEIMKSAQDDPLGLDIDKNFKEKETKKFLETQESLGLNMAVVWFMVDALQYFGGLKADQIKRIAFEIAMTGTQGINPAPGHSYSIKSIPNKEFSGYHLLAYYYVSWKLAIPEMLGQLQLPFDKEYEEATLLFNQNKTHE